MVILVHFVQVSLYYGNKYATNSHIASIKIKGPHSTFGVNCCSSPQRPDDGTMHNAPVSLHSGLGLNWANVLEYDFISIKENEDIMFVKKKK